MGRRKDSRSLEGVLEEDFTYNPETGVLYRLGQPSGTLNGRGYLTVTIKNKQYLVHRCVWYLCCGEWPREVIDHIDRDKTNNRIRNLRDVSQKINVGNSNPRSDNKSGWPCVSWDNTVLKWSARKWVGGVYKFMGYHSCPTKAYLHIEKELL